MSRRRGWIRLIEEGYRLARDEEAWLRALAEAAPFEERLEGIVGYTFELTPQAMRLGPVVQVGGELDFFHITSVINTDNDQDALDSMYRSGMVTGTMSETVFRQHPEQADRYVELSGGRVRDAIGVVARDGRGAGAVLTEPLRKARDTSAPERARWVRASAHLGAGLRLRRRLSSDDLDDPNVEAILDPSGKVADARGPARPTDARERLRAAARAIDRARTHQRSDPEEALELWQALVSGRWSLIDQHDSDGRRWVVARRNDIAAGDPRGLTPREQEVAELVGLGEANKAIAYRLGVSQAAVSAHVRQAIDKLGLGGRAELALFFAPAGPRWRLSRMELAGEPLLVARSAGLREELLEPLTDAERAIALELVRGTTTDVIATERGTSASTVANQIGSIYDKLGVGSRGELAAALYRPADGERASAGA